MTTLQRVQKYRADTQKYLNERKRERERFYGTVKRKGRGRRQRNGDSMGLPWDR